MKQANRRTFLRQIGLTVGALTFGAGQSAAFLYQKTTTLRKAPGPIVPETVDFRYAPDDWHSPISPPGGTAVSFIGRPGGLLRHDPVGGIGSIALHVDGAGPITASTQRCEAPHIPIVRTSLSYGEATVEMTAFSSAHDDEGPVDNITVTVTPAAAPLSLRFVVRPGGPLRTEMRDEDDIPGGRVCVVEREGGSGEPLLFLDAEPTVSRDADGLVLSLNVTPGGGPAPAVFHLRVPRGKGDEDDIISGTREISTRAERETARWEEWKSRRGPAGWDLPGIYGEFSVAAARVLDQMTPAISGGSGGDASRVPAVVPDLVDQHCIAEAELYLGRMKEAKSRLESVWNLEDDMGLIIGAGGEANMKEMSAAVYSLCRLAELTGDWALFNELYPDAFNALNALRLRRDKAVSLSQPTAHGSRSLLPEGSPGTGWNGPYEELTNSLWTLIALKPMLEISDRHFLLKKSEIREFYGQLRLAVVQTARDTQRQDPSGFSWFPMVTGPAGRRADGDGVAGPQAGLGTLSLGVFPGLLFRKDDRIIQDFPRRVQASLTREIPSGTGPAGGTDPVDAALAAQALIWFNLPEEARGVFIGFLNHAAPVLTWRSPSWRETVPGSVPVPVDLRAQAESVRYLRHAMVMEDEDVLRLFDGIAGADLADARPLKLERTPTRWGLVSVTLEPVDAKSWKISFLREPVNPEKAPPLRSVELPRVLAPNFRFDTISPVTAIKNGPRVIIDGAAMRWEAFLRDLRR